MRGAVRLLQHTQYMASRPNRYTKLSFSEVPLCLSHMGRLNRSARPARLAALMEMLPHAGRYVSILNTLQVGYNRLKRMRLLQSDYRNENFGVEKRTVLIFGRNKVRISVIPSGHHVLLSRCRRVRGNKQPAQTFGAEINS
jgi:hypothetical protein